MFEITKDYIAEPGEKSRVGEKYDLMPQYAMEQIMGLDDMLPTYEGKVKFRLRDEDGMVHYEGVLDDDPDCINQSAALRFGETDTGACIIEVERETREPLINSRRLGGRFVDWKIEIG